MEPSLHKALFAQKKIFEDIVVVEWKVFKYPRSRLYPTRRFRRRPKYRSSSYFLKLRSAAVYRAGLQHHERFRMFHSVLYIYIMEKDHSDHQQF